MPRTFDSPHKPCLAFGLSNAHLSRNCVSFWATLQPLPGADLEIPGAPEPVLSLPKDPSHLATGETNPDCEEVLATFDEPQRAVTPGQSAVFYDGNEVVGGGWIV